MDLSTDTLQTFVHELSESSSTSDRVLTVLAFRLVLVTGILVLLVLLGISPSGVTKGFQVGPVFPVIVALYTITALYSFVASRRAMDRWFLYFQFFVDAGFVALFLTRTGGIVDNPFSVLFVFNILGAGLLLMLPGALTVATVDSVLFILLLAYEAKAGEGIGGTGAGTNERLLLVSQTAIHFLGFFLAAFVAGLLARESKKSAKALADLRELHDNIVRSLSTGVITLDEAGQITSANRASLQVLGVARTHLVGRRFSELLHLPKTSGVGPAQQFERAVDGELERHARSFEGWMNCPDGVRRYLRTTVSDLLDSAGRPMGSSLVIDDLSEQRDLEQRGLRDERLAAVGRLSAGIAHEIRNPLTAISGSLQVLGDRTVDESTRGRLLSIVQRETERLNRLVDNFLSLSRPDSGGRTALQLVALVDSLLDVVVHDPRFAQVRLQRDFRVDSRVFANEDALRQLFLNLVVNAAQAMPEGGLLTVGVGREFNADREHSVSAIVWVEDEGHGVAVEERERIFDPFYTRKSGGTGLGLAVAAGVAESHGGALRVEDGARGARFVVCLPCLDSTDEKELQ